MAFGSPVKDFFGFGIPDSILHKMQMVYSACIWEIARTTKQHVKVIPAGTNRFEQNSTWKRGHSNLLEKQNAKFPTSFDKSGKEQDGAINLTPWV